LTERLLTAAEVAVLLNVPKGWPLEQARAGNIPHVRLGRYVRFRESAIVVWVERLEQAGSSGARYRKHEPRVGAP
jgi:excisionase family DNA binding protein